MIPGLQYDIYQIKAELILQGVNLSNIDKIHAQKGYSEDSDTDSDEYEDEGATPGMKPKRTPKGPKGKKMQSTPVGTDIFNINVERKSELKISFRN